MKNTLLDNYLEILKTIPHPVSVNDTDEDFKYVFGNQQFCMWAGVDPNEEFNKGVISFWGEEIGSRIVSIDKKIIEIGEPYYVTEPLYMPNGEMRYTAVEKTRLNIGNHNYIVTSLWDKTEEYLAKQQVDIILNNSNAGFVFLSPDYKVKWENVSSVFKDMPMSTIYKTDTCCYRDYFKRNTPCENCIMAKAIASNKPETEQYSNNDMTIKVDANPVYDTNNKLTGVVLKVVNFTEQNRQFQKLKVANSKIRKYNSFVDMAIHDSDLYTWAYDIAEDRFFDNSGTMMRYGLNPELSLDAKDLLERVHPDFKEQFRQKFYKLIQTGEKQSIDCKILTVKKNQEDYEWFRYMSALFIDENRKKILIGTAQCINNFVRERELLNDLISEAENNSNKSFAFLANMSHEIRTPLNSIVGFSQLLENTDDIEEKHQYISIINTNSDMLMNLINDILDMSKLEAGKMVDKPASFDLSLFFEEIMASLKQRLTNPDIRLIVENPYKRCIVELDKNRVAQVITNYVTNAFKYTDKGSVTVGYHISGVGIRLYVKDTGIGIPKEKQSQVFGRFVKLDSHANGNGLGLSIVKGLTESIGGKVGFESEEGVGSTFWAWKPTKYEVI